MGEVGKLLFLLAGRISTSLIGSFGSSGCSFSPHLFMLGSFHPPILHFVCLFFRTGMGLFAFLQKRLTTGNERGTCRVSELLQPAGSLRMLLAAD